MTDPFLICYECGFKTEDLIEASRHEKLLGRKHRMWLENLPKALVGVLTLCRTKEGILYLYNISSSDSPFIRGAKEFLKES